MFPDALKPASLSTRSQCGRVQSAGSNPGLALTSHVTFLSNFCVPQCPHLISRCNNSTFLTGLSQGLIELMHAKHLLQWLTFRKYVMLI